MGKNVIELNFNAANQLFEFNADATIKVGSINNNILSIAGPYSTTNALLTSYLLANGNTVNRKRATLTSDTREVDGNTLSRKSQAPSHKKIESNYVPGI